VGEGIGIIYPIQRVGDWGANEAAYIISLSVFLFEGGFLCEEEMHVLIPVVLLKVLEGRGSSGRISSFLPLCFSSVWLVCVISTR
jgi:hypothetical protein